jgi:hypothetical protein
MVAVMGSNKTVLPENKFSKRRIFENFYAILKYLLL